MAGTDLQTIKFIDGPPPESFIDDNPMSDLSNFEQAENNFENQSNLDALYNSPNTTNWDEVTPMTGSHIPGVDTGAQNGQTTFMGGDGQMRTIGSGAGSFGGGSTPYESMLRDHLLSQLPSGKPESLTAQTVCNGSNLGFVDSTGRLNLCIYGSSTPGDQDAAVLPQSESTLGAGDVIGSGLAVYSTGMGQLLEKNGVTVASRFGIQYGLPGLVADLPGAAGGAIGLGETYAKYQNGDNRGAFETGTGTIGGVLGVEGGAAVGAEIGAGLAVWFPPAELVTLPLGALVGGLVGTAIGREIGQKTYNHLDPQPGNAQHPTSKR